MTRLALRPEAGEVVAEPRHSANPRVRFMCATYLLRASVRKLSNAEVMAAFTAQNIFQMSSLVDEQAEPDIDAAGRIIRILANINHDEARHALGALGDMLARPLGEAA